MASYNIDKSLDEIFKPFEEPNKELDEIFKPFENDIQKENTKKSYKTTEDLIAEIKEIEPDYIPPENVINIRPRPDISNIIPITYDQLCLDTPKDLEYVFSPCLPTQGIAWIYAATGLGKTLFTLNLAYAIAGGGSFLKYNCPKPRKVLYVDGEMPYNQLHSRIMQIAKTQGSLDFPENFRVLTPDKLVPFRVPFIDDQYGQSVYVDIIKKYDIEVIIFDNLSMLSSFDENKSHEFKTIQDWLLYLRSLGKSIVIVHHSGKGGDYRGTSRMLDCADVAIGLEPVNNNELESDVLNRGKQFTIKYKKSRVFGGADALPFEVTLDAGFWRYRSMEQTELDKVVDLVNMKMSQRDIAKEMVVSLGKVNKLVTKARKIGLLKD